MNKNPLKQWYIEHGICINCGSEYAEPHKQICFECWEKQHVRDCKKYWADPERAKRDVAERRKLRRGRRYAAGLCTECGKRPHMEKIRECWACREKRRARDKQYNRSKGRLPSDLRGNGEYCYRCCLPKCNGEKVCADCLTKLREGAAKARKNVDRGAHLWAKLDHANVIEYRAKKKPGSAKAETG